MKRKHLEIFFRTSLSIVFLLLILYKVGDIRKALEIACNIPLWTLAAAVFLYFFSYIISSYRWQILFDRENKPALAFLLRKNLIALFFNNILPTAIGGDVYRGLSIKRYGFSTVFMERLVGFSAVALLSVAGLYYIKENALLKKMSILLIIFAILIMMFYLIIFIPKFALMFIRFFRKIKIFNIGKELSRFWVHLSRFRKRKIDLLKVFIISILYQLVVVIINLILGYALGIEIPFLVYCTGVSLVAIVTSLPSIGGIGFREGGYYILVTMISGKTSEEAFAFSTVIFALTLFGGLTGSILYLTERKK
ncbi:MAG: flippase-like domain-containing protein [Candidatus Coatesbacteria bacterium]|nr:flippase-like domain-containing protein [Candidatus Coatesbacteria bacterium]